MLELWSLTESRPTPLAAAACLAVVIALVVRQVQNWYRLRHIPGPQLAAWSILWQLQGCLSGKYHEKLQKVAEEYGPLVRIGPNELLSTDPEVLRRIGGVRSSYTKGAFYKSGRVTPEVDSVVSIRDEAMHKAMRAKMAMGYAGRESHGFEFEDAMDSQVMSFMNLLETKYVSTTSETRPFDLAEKTQYFALDTIADISLGAPFGFTTRDEDLFDYNKINESSLPVMNLVSVLPGLTIFIHKWPLKLLMPKEGDNVGFGRFMSLASQVVDERLNEKASEKTDMLQSHIKNGMTRDELIQQFLIFLIAGSNSTAQALRMTLLSLITSPSAYTSLLDEIKQASGKVKSPISWAETQTLPYLQAVVLEGLRIWPPVAGLGFKTVPPAGDNINGFFVPGGTDIGQGFHGVGRSRAVWGPDADVFRPERWLLANEAELQKMTAAVDTHFGGSGKFSCLGKNVALMEIHKSLFEILKRYDVSLIYPHNPVKITSSVFMGARDFWVKIMKRDS